MKEAVVVLGLCMIAFTVARQHLIQTGFERNDYTARCVAWLLLNCAAFLLGNFWLYVVVSGAAMALFAQRDSNRIALFCFLLFAVPNIARVIPGIGPIDSIIVLSHHRLAAMLILLPIAFLEFSTATPTRPHFRFPDILVSIFLIWTVGSSAAHSESVTILIRMSAEAFLDVVLPYYAASRCITRVGQFYDVAGAIVAAVFASALIAMFESARTWLLYEALKWKWEDLLFNLVQVRGILRASAASASPITLGFNMVVGLGFAYVLRYRAKTQWRNTVIMAGLVGGLLATVSRGPWVGAMALVFAMASIGPGNFKRLTKLLVGGAVVTVALLVSPYGDVFVSYLPWIGSVEANTIDFRETIFLNSLSIIAENPIFGNHDFGSHPLLAAHSYEGGFQDIANTYLGIALVYGLFGLSVFLLIMISSLLRLRSIVKHADHLVMPARTMFGILFGMGVIMGTASMGGEMPVLFWLITGVVTALYGMIEKDHKMSVRTSITSRQVV